MKRWIAGLLTMTLLLAAALSAPAGSEAPEAAPGSPDAYDGLTVAVTTPLTGQFFTGQWGNGMSDLDVRAMIHGCDLVVWNAAQGMFVTNPAVVSGMVVTQDPDGSRTYTIALHGDLRFSDGSPITAWDYAFSVLLPMTPEMAALGGRPQPKTWLAGSGDYMNGTAPALAGLRVLADDQLAFTVSGEYLPFFYELGLLTCVPYPIAVIAPGARVADDGNGAYLVNAEDPEAPALTADLLRQTLTDPETGYISHPAVVSGPYVLTDWADGTAVFEINPYYKGDWTGAKPTIRRITFRSMRQEELVPALAAGEADLLNKMSGAEVIGAGLSLVGENDLYTVSNYTRSGLSFIAFNGEKSAAADVRVRQAVAFAMDREALVRGSVGDYGQAAAGYFGLGQWMYQILNGNMDYPVTEPGEGSGVTPAAYEAELAAWEALSLDSIEPYGRDPERAAALLDEAGWNLNEKGGAFVPGRDTLRYRMGENGPEPLRLRLALAEGSAAEEALRSGLAEDLAAVGIELTVDAIPMAQLLPQYYHTEDSEYDMFFLATNFDLVYDPSAGFLQDADGGWVWMYTGLRDDALREAAVAMRRTEPGDLLGYCTAWLAFQRRFAESLPMIPVYSNIYFDFYPTALRNYEPSAAVSWPQAIVPAFMGDPAEPAPAEEAEDVFVD